MEFNRRILILGGLLMLAGGAGYYFSDPVSHDPNATYVLSRTNGGKWERSTISGADLNAENPRDKAMNQVMSGFFVAGGAALVIFQVIQARRTR